MAPLALFMRNVLGCLMALAVGTQAQASAGVWCSADDASIKFSLSASYGRSIGSGPGNFGGEIAIKLKDAPEAARKFTLDMTHLSQNWFQGRDVKLTVHWLKEGDAPSPEVVLIVETRRGAAEESPYRGRYTLLIFSPDAAGGKPRKARGRAECSAD